MMFPTVSHFQSFSMARPRKSPEEASLLNFSSVVILRDYDWSFVRTSAVSAAEWSRMATLRLVGPTERWCFRWSNKTRTCGLVDFLKCVEMGC